MDTDEEIFEISDFTAVTEIEQLSIKLEAVLREWQASGLTQPAGPLTKGAFESGVWTEHRAEVPHVSRQFAVVLRRLSAEGADDGREEGATALAHLPTTLADLLDSASDFADDAIGTRFGVRCYVQLRPICESDKLHAEDERNAVLSAVSTAALAADCSVPIFVQMGSRPLHLGVCHNRNVRALFDSVILRDCPPRLQTLSGLLDMFKEKVACALVGDAPPVKVSVRMSYVLTEAPDVNWTHQDQLTDLDDLSLLPGRLQTGRLPFGVLQDPLKRFELNATWPSASEDVMVENDVFSDLDPLTAPYWSSKVVFGHGLTCLSHDCLHQLVDATRRHTAVDSVLGIEEASLVGGALDNLTASAARRVVAPAASSLSFDYAHSPAPTLPLSPATVDRLLSFIFNNDASSDETESAGVSCDPVEQWDAASDSCSPGGAMVDSGANDAASPPPPPVSANVDSLLLRVVERAKGAPQGSATSRFAISLCVLLSVDQLTAFCQLWREVLTRLRYYWESGTLIPSVETDAPNAGSCLLHQKLVMLQNCIAAKRARLDRLSKRGAEQSGATMLPDDSFLDDDGDDEQFEDALEDVATVTAPQGRRAPLAADATLLRHPTELVYVPETQDAGPMTEDMVERRAVQLAASSAATHLDALQSDMQAFKAANPGCIIADFIRWHSPRDFIADAPEDECLSARMTAADNPWLRTWADSQPIPVSRQKRLFNESKEAEQILHWLAGFTVSAIATHILPTIAQSMLIQLYDEVSNMSGLLQGKLKCLNEKLLCACSSGDVDDFRALLGDVHWVESSCAQYRALRARFQAASQLEQHASRHQLGASASARLMHEFTVELMTNDAVRVVGAADGPLGAAVRLLFAGDVRVASDGDVLARRLPPCSRKEYVLRWLVPRPAPFSRPCPQRLCVLVDPARHFCMSAAFTEDTTLF